MRTTHAMLDFLSPLSIIPGMGPKRVDAMQESGIATVGDLLYHFPRRYIDRTVIIPIHDAGPHLGQTITVKGTITAVNAERGKRQRLRATLTDENGVLDLLWFQGIRYIKNAIHQGATIIATGKVTSYNGFQMVHPSIEQCPGESGGPVYPVLPLYGLTTAMRDAGIHQQLRRKTIRWVLTHCRHFPQNLPEKLVEKHNLPTLEQCLNELHYPSSLDTLNTFRNRIRVEELYKLALDLHFNRTKFRLPGRSLSAKDLYDTFLRALPFQLTTDQENAATQLLNDCASPDRMHRLLQGDVGSGKTVVALIAALPSLAQGYQVVWMTPTEVLADQTYRTISKWLAPLGFNARLYTGSSRHTREYPHLKKSLADGSCKFIIGTHALFQPGISFHTVGIFIIDEQHRFGANQRLLLHDKDCAADFLLLSATPIPQTLAKTLYGDLDIVSLRSRPPGRRQVATHCITPDKRAAMEQFIAKELSAGRQYFHIVPRVDKEESVEEDTTRPLADIETTYNNLSEGTLRPFAAAFVHGKLDSNDKRSSLDEFRTGTKQILVATSVVEVGIDVPSASIIVIENPERFGLAQLHQFRGRVGRGTHDSWCFLMISEPVDPITLQKLTRFCKMHDGFSVAEFDLDQRGPGEVTGFKQSGWDDLIMADILQDADLFYSIRQDIKVLLTGHF